MNVCLCLQINLLYAHTYRFEKLYSTVALHNEFHLFSQVSTLSEPWKNYCVISHRTEAAAPVW